MAASVAVLSALIAPVAANDASSDPLVLVVSLAKQRLQVFRGNEAILESKVSTGQAGHRTPSGVYSILQKRREHFSNLYGGAPMPFMQRITWSGIALHAGHIPGYPASHGCIRLPREVAQRLFSMTAMGARVIVSDQPVEPRLIAHERLFRPLPLGDGASSAEAAPAGIEPVGGPHGQGRRIASADGRALVDLVSVSSSTVTLDTASPRRPRTQIEARRMREAERAGFEAAIENAKARRAEAESELLRLKAMIEDSQKAETRTLRETERLAQMKAKAEAMVVEARRILEKEYAEITPDTELPPDRLAELAEREKALDALLMDRDDEARIARDEHQEATAALAGARTGRAEIEARFTTLRTAIVTSSKDLAAAEQALKDYQRRMKSRELPISIFVSAKTGKVDIRQGFNIIHEAPVEVSANSQPIGTHVFTAVRAAGPREAPALTWSVTTAETPAAASQRRDKNGGAAKGRGRSTGAGEDQAASTSLASSFPATPAGALERIQLDEETRAIIAELIRPGSSLVVTDRGPSNETGKYTDVIVDIR